MPKVRRKPPTVQPAANPGLDSLADAAIWIGLILAIFAVYAQLGHFDFVNDDDPDYVTANTHVGAPVVTPANIRWAFTAVVSANWMPVTLLSHMLDVQLFGIDSGMHHLVTGCCSI